MLDIARVKGDLDLLEILSKYSPGSVDAMRDELWNRVTIHHQIRWIKDPEEIYRRVFGRGTLGKTRASEVQERI